MKTVFNPAHISFLFIFFLFGSKGLSSNPEKAIFFTAPGHLAPGVNIHFIAGHTKDLDLIASGGFRYIRTDFIWQEIEYSKGKYNWDAYDELVANLEQRSINAIFILDYSNSLYEDPVKSKDPITGSVITDIAAPVRAESIEAFSRWAAQAATRYKGKHIVWEIWNEPNISFWRPVPDVEQYNRLAASACRAVRMADPDATIIGPATSQIPFEFIESFMKSGILSAIDGLSVHPYRDYALPPESSALDYVKLRELIKQYAPEGKKDIPVISSEWGYASCPKGVTPEVQAAYAIRMQLSNLACSVPVSIWYDWKNDGDIPTDFEHNCGTVTSSLVPKPSYTAFKILAGQLGELKYNHRIDTGNSNDYVLLFSGEKGIFRICAWTTGADHDVKIDALFGKFNDITACDGFGAQIAIKTEKDGLTLNLSGMPQYITLPCGIRLN